MSTTQIIYTNNFQITLLLYKNKKKIDAYFSTGIKYSGYLTFLHKCIEIKRIDLNREIFSALEFSGTVEDKSFHSSILYYVCEDIAVTVFCQELSKKGHTKDKEIPSCCNKIAKKLYFRLSTLAVVVNQFCTGISNSAGKEPN